MPAPDRDKITAELKIADAARNKERDRCVAIARFAGTHAKNDDQRAMADAIVAAIQNSAI